MLECSCLLWRFLRIDHREDRTGQIGRGIHQLVSSASTRQIEEEGVLVCWFTTGQRPDPRIAPLYGYYHCVH
jgi:hypothetical protein